MTTESFLSKLETVYKENNFEDFINHLIEQIHHCDKHTILHVTDKELVKNAVKRFIANCCFLLATEKCLSNDEFNFMLNFVHEQYKSSEQYPEMEASLIFLGKHVDSSRAQVKSFLRTR